MGKLRHAQIKLLANRERNTSTETSLFKKRTAAGEKDTRITDSRTGREK